jgi:hypothetical protein
VTKRAQTAAKAGMEKISSILRRIRIPGPGPLHVRQIQEALAAELGEQAARDVRFASFRSGTLVLECRSAARAFEWQAFARGELAARLKTRPGLEGLAEVKFRNGSWRGHGRA